MSSPGSSPSGRAKTAPGARSPKEADSSNEQEDTLTRIRAHTANSRTRLVMQNVKDWQQQEATSLGLQVALHSSGSAALSPGKKISKEDEAEMLGRLYKPPKASLVTGPPKPAVEPEMKQLPSGEVQDVIKRLYVQKSRTEFAKPTVVPEKRYVESVNDVVARLAVPKVKPLGLNESGRHARGGWGCQWDL